MLAAKYRVIAHDNRGAGRSDKPFGAYTLEQMVDDAIAVLDHEGVDTAHVVGASMGGAISQILAVKYPERVRSLTLLCTACRNHEWRRDLLRSWSDTATTRGMGLAEMEQIAQWSVEAIAAREDAAKLEQIRREVVKVAQRFPVPGNDAAELAARES